MNRSLLLATGMVAALTTAPADAQIGVGAMAPEIEAKQWYNAPEAGTSLAELRGRVVFVEFWATW